MNNTELKEKEQELSVEQKIWKAVGCLFYAVRPFILYVTLPGLLMIVGMILPGNRSAEEMISGSGNFYYTLGILLTMVLLHKRSKKRGYSLWEDATLDYKELDKRRIRDLICMGFGFGFFFSALITVVPFPKVLIDSYSGLSNSLNTGTDTVLALIATIILAPVAEEIIFRGYMLNRLLSWFQEQHSVLISTAIFALCHISPIWMVYAFIMGLFLAKVSIKEDNIAHSVALHMGFNLNVLPIWIIHRIPALESVLFANHILIAIYGAAALCMGIWYLKKYRRETET